LPEAGSARTGSVRAARPISCPVGNRGRGAGAAAAPGVLVLGGSPIWLRPRRIASSGSLRLLWLRPESACDPRLLRPWLDDPGHDPAVLADLAVTGEPELLVGRQGTVEQESGGHRAGALRVSLDGPAAQTRDEVKRTGAARSAPGTPRHLRPVPVPVPVTADRLSPSCAPSFPHHVTLPPVYTPPGGRTRRLAAAQFPGAAVYAPPTARTIRAPDRAAAAGKRPWRLTMESSASAGRVASAVLDRRRGGRR
jgi:hypothetical protein